jgi:hypothetical protein
MAVTPTPIFAQAVRHSAVAISTANTNRDGTGTIGTVFTADATDGSVIDSIQMTATGTTTAGVIRLYKHNGSTAFLWKEILVGAITPSATVAAFMRRLDCSLPANACYLPAGWSLRASTHNAEAFNVHAEGFDL